MSRSRLQHNKEAKTKKSIFLSLGGIIAIILLLYFVGLPVLEKASVYLGNMSSNSEDEAPKDDDATYIPSPILDQSYEATNSSVLNFSGNGRKGDKIRLYLNDDYKEEVEVKSNNRFLFENVNLLAGENVIKVRATDDKGHKSDYSEEITVVVKSEPPSLSIDSPSDGVTIKGDRIFTVRGKTDSDVGVTVNGFRAIVTDTGEYSYQLSFNDGDNELTVVATDQAGNKTEKKIRITYSP